MNFHDEFIKRINCQPGINGQSLLRALREPSTVSIRINGDKWTKQPCGGTNVPWCPDGWYLGRRPSFTLDPLFHSGCYYPQEASGMFVGEAFRQVMMERSDIRVLDLCGAPGGKSTHLASLIGNRGILVSNEVIKSRANILAGNMARWGKLNTIVTSSDPSSFSKLEGYFDLIAVDAPCSGEGMFRDEVAVREWSPSNALLCSERQKRIVMDVWPSLSSGGYMIYSTCTFNPAENEENIKWIADNCEGESVRLNRSGFNGIHEISYEGITGYGFYPDRINGEGFFLSVIRKKGNTAGREQVRKKHSFRTDMKEEKITSKRLLKKDVPYLMREDDDVFAIPAEADEYAMLRRKLNIIKRGVHLYQVKGSDIIPSHELVLSELFSDGAFPSFELDQRNAVSFLRKENLKSERLPDGWVTVKYLGVNIGLVKNIGKRINNYFPVGWRIRMPAERESSEIISWI
jgi:16S rRNA C967 or C1407 C5-methylase (RsmB/RsmF family)/NOL1/NOP2/fmu family ribosome biogenesis protein